MRQHVLVHAALVGIGGFAGSLLRYLVSGAVHRALPAATFPWGTLTVNTLGCLVIGALTGLSEARQVLGPQARLFLLLGVLGGFTTFSTFGYETFALVRDAEHGRAVLSVASHLVVGLSAVWLGHALATSLGG